MQFTHVAGYHAGLVVRNILFKLGAKENLHILPRVTFSDPEMAHVGYSEDQARQKFRKIRVLRWPYAENDRARGGSLDNRFHQDHHQSQGAGAWRFPWVGANAGEIINMWSLIVAQKMNIKAVTGYVSPYPTYAGNRPEGGHQCLWRAASAASHSQASLLFENFRIGDASCVRKRYDWARLIFHQRAESHV